MSDPKISFMSPFVFTLICMAMMGGLIGLIAGVANGSGPVSYTHLRAHETRGTRV